MLLQVSHLVGIAKGDMLRTPEEVLHAVDLAQSGAKPQILMCSGAEPQTSAAVPAARPPRPTVPAAEGLRPVGSIERTRPGSGPDTAQAEVLGVDSAQGKALKLLASRLPQTTVRLADGKQAKAVKLPASSAGYSGRTSLLANGLAPIPASAGVKIEVRIVEAPGFLGPKPPGAPLILTTDAKGKTTLDFFVYPYGAGDPVNGALPWPHEAVVVNL